MYKSFRFMPSRCIKEFIHVCPCLNESEKLLFKLLWAGEIEIFF